MDKSKFNAFAAMMAVGAMQESENQRSNYRNGKPNDVIDDILNFPTKKKMSESEKHLANGLKEFDYDGEKIYAINQKVADKKARKRSLIN